MVEMPNMFNHPKNRKARYHRLTLQSGHILEIGWHFGRQMYVTTLWHPKDYENNDTWCAEKQFFGRTPREVLSGARREIAEQINPDIRKVRERMGGGIPGKSILDSLMDMKHQMTSQQLQHGNPTIYVSPEIERELRAQLGAHSMDKGLFAGIPIRVNPHLKPNEAVADIDLEPDLDLQQRLKGQWP